MSIELHSKIPLALTQCTGTRQDEIVDRPQHRITTDSRISALSKEVIFKEAVEQEVKMLTRKPGITVLGLLVQQFAQEYCVSVSEPEEKISIQEQADRSPKTWALISFKILKGIAARRNELERIGISCPKEPITEERFLSILMEMKEQKRREEESMRLEESTSVCMRIWYEELERAQKEVFGLPMMHFFQQAAQLPAMMQAMKIEKVSLPSLSIDNMSELSEKTFKLLGKHPELKKALDPLTDTLGKECDEVLNTKEAALLFSYALSKQ